MKAGLFGFRVRHWTGSNRFASLAKAARLPEVRAKPRPWLCISATEPSRRGRPRASGSGSSVAPPELPPTLQDPWQWQQQGRAGGSRAGGSYSSGGSDSQAGSHYSGGGYSGSGSGGGSSAGGSSSSSRRQKGAVRRRHALRELMMECHSAAELHNLLLDQLRAVATNDVAFAWHLAAMRQLFDGGGAAATSLHALLSQLAEKHLAAMGPVAMATTAWACAASQLPCAPLLGTITKQAEPQIFAFRPRELCALLWASALGAPGSIRLLKRVGLLLEGGMSLELFTAHDLSVLVWSCGKVEYNSPVILEAATKHSIALAAQFDPPSAARLLHGFAMLQHRPPGLIDPLSERCKAAMEQFQPHELSLLMSSLGKLLCDPGLPFLLAASSRSAAVMPDCRPEHAANLIWGFARLGFTPVAGRFLHKLCTHMSGHLQEYGCELVASVLWSLAKMQHTPPAALLDKVLAFMTKVMTNQSTASLAHTIWAFGILATGSPKLAESHGQQFRAFAVAAAAQLERAGRELSVDDMPSVLIALATLQVQPQGALASRLIEGCAQAAGTLPGDSLARMAWAAAALQLRDRKLITAIVQAPGAVQLQPQSIAQLAWSLAALEVAPRNLLSAWAGLLCDATAVPAHGPDPIRPVDRARILWAYAQLGAPYPELVARLLGGLKSRDAAEMGPTGVAAALWACGKLRISPGAETLGVASEYVMANVQRFTRMQLLQVGWALTSLGYRDARVLTTMAMQLQKTRPGEGASSSSSSASQGYEAGLHGEDALAG